MHSTLTILLPIFFVLLNLLTTPCYGLEAKWTPSYDEEPLPLSASYRSQLKGLADVVRTSQDPQATLEKLAKGQGMEVGELKSMLERVESEAGVVSGGQVRGASSVFVSATEAVLACSLSVVRFSARRPLVLFLLAMSIFAVTRLSASGERTIPVPGFVGLTAGKPGKAWRSSFMESHSCGGRLTKVEWGDSIVERKKDVRVSSQIDNSLIDEACAEVVNARSFDSYLPSDILITKPPIGSIRRARKLREVGGKGKEGLVLSWGGPWGFWRSERFAMRSESGSKNENSTTPTTTSVTYVSEFSLPTVTITASTGSKGKHSVNVKVTFDEGTGRMDKQRAKELAEVVADSCRRTIAQVASSKNALSSQRAKLNLSLKTQNEEKKRKRGEEIKDMEGMGRVKKRRWQRGTGGGGSWRPSGERQRSPNNC